MCVCVCVCLTERERECECETESVCVCVCACVCERDFWPYIADVAAALGALHGAVKVCVRVIQRAP